MKEWQQPMLISLNNNSVQSGGTTYYRFEQVILAGTRCGVAATFTGTANSRIVSFCGPNENCFSVYTVYAVSTGNPNPARRSGGVCS